MREGKIRKMGWMSELKGLNLELRVQIHLQLYPTIHINLTGYLFEFYWIIFLFYRIIFLATTKGNFLVFQR
jgi:hypothetical protein